MIGKIEGNSNRIFKQNVSMSDWNFSLQNDC